MVIAASGFFLSCGSAQGIGASMSDRQINQQIKETIAKVREGATPTIRDDAAQRLADLTRTVGPKEVDRKNIRDIVSLLDLPDGRLWVATSLGNIGPRARIAIPKLQELMAVEDCRQVSMSASLAIRRALENMGVTPPPFPPPLPGPCPKP